MVAVEAKPSFEGFFFVRCCDATEKVISGKDVPFLVALVGCHRYGPQWRDASAQNCRQRKTSAPEMQANPGVSEHLNDNDRALDDNLEGRFRELFTRQRLTTMFSLPTKVSTSSRHACKVVDTLATGDERAPTSCRDL